jgi:tetratricopeptide (TPR) repeat protein
LAALTRRAAGDPWDARSRREKGELLARLGRRTEALRVLDEAAPLSRADVRLHHLAGRLRLEAGDARGALADAARMRAIDPLSLPARLLAADAWSALGLPARAACELRAAAGIFPGEASVLGRLASLFPEEKEKERLAAEARAAARSGRLSEAVALYSRLAGAECVLPAALELPTSPRQDLSYTLAWSGALPAASLRGARSALLRAARERPFEPELLLLLGALELHLELPSAAARLSLAAWLAADWPECWIWRHAARVQEWRRSKRWSGLAELGLADLERAMARSNGDCRPYLLRAEILADHESKEAALSDLEKALKLDPDNSWALAERSELRCDRGDLSGAMTDLRRLSRRHHGAAWTSALRARLWANSNRPALAIKEIARVLRRDPRNGVVWAWRAEMERRYGLLREAGRHFARARALDPGYTLGRAWRARWLLQTGRASLAARELAEVARRDPRHLLVHAWLGEALLRLGRHREAAAAYENAEPLDPRTAWNGPVRRGEKLRESARRAGFEKALDEAVEAWPRSAWAWFLRGRFLVDSPRRREGLESLTRALALAPGHSRALGWRGEARRRDGDAEGALADLTAALAADPAWAWARSCRALALQALGQGEAALFEAGEAARLLPQSSGARRVHGQVLSLAGRHAEAARELDRALLLDGKDAEARLWLSEALRLMGRKSAA